MDGRARALISLLLHTVHSVWKSPKKSNSTLPAKSDLHLRLLFEWTRVQKCQRYSIWSSLRSILATKKCENAQIEKFKRDIWGNFPPMWGPRWPKNSGKCRHVQLLRSIPEKLVSNYLSLIDFLHGNGNVHRAIIHFGLLSEKIFFSLEFWCYCATLPQCETMIMLMKLFILINSADRGRYSFKPLIHQR